ncbi:MAG: type II toxin-antitoxin system VapC family toxin [Candidatus Hodarchaeales archaeon]
MSIFLDTSIIVAFLNVKDSHNPSATTFFETLWDGDYGKPLTSDYVIDECYTLLMARTNNLSLQENLYSLIHGNKKKNILKFIDLRFITPELYELTWKAYKTYESNKLSFTDLSNLVVCKKFNITAIASFDSDFDGLLTRISA